MSLLNNLPHRCRIQKRTTVTDSIGGRRVVRVTLSSNVPCWEQQASVNEVQMYQKDGMSLNKKVFFSSDPGITDQCEIVITARKINGVLTDVAAADEVILQNVLRVDPDASAGLGRLWRVMCNDIPGAVT